MEDLRVLACPRPLSRPKPPTLHAMQPATVRQYFGGDGANLGLVSRLPVNTFADFVKECLGHPAILNVTRAQYAQLDKDRRNAVKRVPYCTPATFSGSKRILPEVTGIALVALDIDDPAQARPLLGNPDRVRDALAPYAYALYRTVSSTPEAPRLRVLVDATVPAARYADAVLFVAARLGLPSVTRESKVAVQPMYLPTVFKDDDPIDDHPLLQACIDGALLLETDLTDTPRAAASAAHRASHNTDEDDAGLEHLRVPVEGVTLQDCAAALQHLDPDCSYAEWLDVASALRHQFARDPDPAYQLFDGWSSLGRKYVGATDTAAKWRSLRPTPKGRAPVTARTLLARAADAGWQGLETVADRLYRECASWLSDPARTAQELMNVALPRIARLPAMTPVQRETLLARLKNAMSEKELSISVSVLKKQLRSMERVSVTGPKAGDAVTPLDEGELPAWARGVCYVAGADEFYHRAADRKFSPEVLDRMHGVHLMANGGEGSESGKPVMRPQDFLLNMARIPRVDAYLYDPSNPGKSFTREGDRRYVNIYHPSYPEADFLQAEEAGAVLTEHLERLVAEPEYRATLRDWMAFVVQNPGVKIRWAVLLQGAMGCGKTALAEMMRAVLGRANVSVVDAGVLFDKYNPWAAGAQVVALEEIRVVGHTRHEVMNRLKPCISNDTVTINDKFVKLQVNVPNIVNYMMFTNHHDALAVTEEDRRYFVVFSALQTKAQVAALGPEYFPRLFDVIQNKAAGLRAYLESHVISKDFNPNGPAPVTKYLKELAGAAESPLAAAVRTAIEDAAHPLVSADLLSLSALRDTCLLETGSRASDWSEQAMANVLRELDFVSVGRIRVGEDRHRLWTRDRARAKTLTPAQWGQLAQAKMKGEDLL